MSVRRHALFLGGCYLAGAALAFLFLKVLR